MSSGWKLVEAVVEQQDVKVDKKTSKKQGKNRKHHYPHKLKDYGSLSSTEKESTLLHVVNEIKYIFSEQNLCMDTFIRSYMDEAGFVPIAVVSCYTNVSPFGVPTADLADAVQMLATDCLEVDKICQTVKVSDKWEMWLMPNLYGGRGVPLYSAQQMMYNQTYGQQWQDQYNQYHDSGNTNDLEETAADAVSSTIDDHPVNEHVEAVHSSSALSATAAEFKPGCSHVEK